MLRAAAAALLLVAVLTPAVQADWPSFHNDARHTGFVASSSYPVFVDVWWNNKTLAKAQIKASPIIKDNVLITADLGSATAKPANVGLVRALDGSSGKELWSFAMPAPVEGTPAVSGERVYVVDTAGNLKALNFRSGTVENSAAAGVGATFGSITLNEDKLFIGNEAGQVKAYLASTLTLLWTFDMTGVNTVAAFNNATKAWTCTVPLSGQPVRGAPVVYDGKVFFGSMNHWIIAVDEQGTGDLKTTVKWVAQTGDILLSTPAVNARSGQPTRVLFTSYDGKAYSFRTTASGEGGNPCFGAKPAPDWTFQVPTIIDNATGESQVSKVHSSPAAAGDKVFFGANNGKVYGLDATTGTRLWETTAGSPLEPVTSSPAVANGTVVVGSQDKKVYWLSASDGKVLKTFTTQAAVETSPAIDGNQAFIAARDGTLYMFGPKIPTRADLVVQSVIATDPANLLVTLKNQGDAASVATTVRIFVGGTFVANVPVGAIDPGQTQSVAQAATIPAGATTLVKAIVDPDNAVTESNDSNNELQTGVAPPAPPPAKKGGGIKIPSLGLAPVLALLALAAIAARRRG